ncbi:MAG TPA: hypothetical protein VMF29_02625 [Candidatus Edwardsbacteria bacterium]|nr:hypothetical protein [Candidatus Edwardsbacteria bacterium]
MKYYLMASFSLLLLAPTSQAQRDTTRAAATAKPPAAAATAAAPKISGAALASEPRDTSDHADNRGDEYFQGSYDNNYQLDNRELYLERDDSDNKRVDDSQPGQSDQSGGGGQE